MTELLIILVIFVVVTLLNAYLDTRDSKNRKGTPFRQNLLPNVIRTAMITALIYAIRLVMT